LAVAERALPNAILYVSAQEGEGGDFSVMVDAIWQHLVVEPNEEEIVELLDEVVSHMPDQDNVDNYGVLPTTDCFSLLEQALLAGVHDEKRRAFEASQTSLSTVTQFIEFSEGDGLSENKLIKLFDSHPLIEREFSFQAELNDLLRAAKHPGEVLISEIRALAQDEGVSNIGISLT